MTPTAAASLAFSPATISLAPGAAAAVQVRITASGRGLGYTFGLEYDPDVIKVTGVTAGTWLDGALSASPPGDFILPIVWSIDNVTGRVTPGGAMILNGSSGATGTGVLATIRLEGVAAGHTALNITLPFVWNEAGAALPVDVAAGQITVG